MNHPCTIECQVHEHKGYRRCQETGSECHHEAGRSISDLIPEWYEGGTQEQMLEEAYAQIRRLEAR